MYQFLIFLLVLFHYGALAAAFSKPATANQRRGHLQARGDVPPDYVAAPYYPAPNGGWIASWNASYAKAAAIVQNMTLAEKVNLTSGTGYFMVGIDGTTKTA